MNGDIAICSMFRDSQSWCGKRINQVDRFFAQLESQSVDQRCLRYFLVEGNSQDDTWNALCDYQYRYAPRVTLYHQDVVGSSVASVEDPQRFHNLSKVGNVVLRAARDSGCRFVFWVESDFILRSSVLADLLEAARQPWWPKALGVCPIPVFEQGGQALFYDTWAFEGLAGERWGNQDLEEFNAPLNHPYLPLHSFGSAALLNGDNLRKYNLDFGKGCFPALCTQARSEGLELYADRRVRITHPSRQNLNGRLV